MLGGGDFAGFFPGGAESSMSIAPPFTWYEQQVGQARGTGTDELKNIGHLYLQ